MPIWAAIALRINALLLGSLLSRSASSVSTLNATTAVLGALRDIGYPRQAINDHFGSVPEPPEARKQGNRTRFWLAGAAGRHYHQCRKWDCKRPPRLLSHPQPGTAHRHALQCF